MPCSTIYVDWPIPWVPYDQSASQPFGCGSKNYIPVGGWEVGARPATITLSLDASVEVPSQEFSIYDTGGVKIGTSPLGVPAGESTKVITLAFGAFDIGFMYANYVDGTSPLLITAIDGLSVPAFWTSFKGQSEL